MNQTELKKLLTYDATTGVFTWLTGARAGDEAGYINRHRGYRYVCIGKRLYLAHRLAWLYVHGVLPKADLDHINRKRADNRLSNLREASRRENLCNSGVHSDNNSGLKGVTYDKRRGQWQARISVNGKTRHLGRFDSPHSAQQAYVQVARQTHGAFFAPPGST